MHRPAQRITRILACAAAVPVILVASGCSSHSSGSGSDDGDGGATPSSSASASTAAARPTFGKLPEPCSTLSKKTRDDLVPDAKSGTIGKSDDTSLRGSCSWNSLDDNGTHGSQFRWLNVSLARFEPDSRGSADQLAGQYYAKQVAAAKATEDATSVHTSPVTGTGDEATAVTYDLKKKEGRFKQQTVVTRTHNVVVTVDYDGAGLAGEKTPDAGDLLKDAGKAAREVVAAVAGANPSSGGSSPSASHSSSSDEDSHGSGSSDSSSSQTPKSSTHKTSH